MSERLQAVLILALVGLLGWALLRLLGTESASTTLLALILSARAANALFTGASNRRDLSKLIANLRALPQDARNAALDRIQPPSFQGYLRDVLDRDGSEEKADDIERFPFPASLRRRFELAYWVAFVGAAAGLTTAALANSLAPSVRVSLVIMGAGLVAGTWFISRRQRSLTTVIEISPFRITEILSDGSRRTLLFNRFLELQVDERRKRAVLRPHGSSDEIVLHFDRMGFNRLAHLVVTYGGFEPAAPAS